MIDKTKAEAFVLAVEILEHLSFKTTDMKTVEWLTKKVAGAIEEGTEFMGKICDKANALSGELLERVAKLERRERKAREAAVAPDGSREKLRSYCNAHTVTNDPDFMVHLPPRTVLDLLDELDRKDEALREVAKRDEDVHTPQWQIATNTLGEKKK